MWGAGRLNIEGGGEDMAAPKGNQYALGASGGRPPMYKTAEQMQVAVDKYFEDCEGYVYKDKDGNPVLDKWGSLVIVGQKPFTVTGLALALGFNSRQSLLNYQDTEEFMDTVIRAKSRCEAYTESRLYDKDGANGAKFSLSNNFKQWAEKQEITGKDGAPLVGKLEDFFK
jgi:hypothetical protein